MAAHQAPLSLGFSRQEHWSGLPFPSPMHESEKWKWSHSVVSDSSLPQGLQPTRLLRPWDFPGKSTGVGCHCLLHHTLLGKHKDWTVTQTVSFTDWKTWWKKRFHAKWKWKKAGLSTVISDKVDFKTHSSTLAWKILWTKEPGRLQSMGSLRVGYDWATSLSLFTFMHWRRKW